MRSALLAIAYPCVVRYLTKKKKPVKAQISDFFYASKDNLQIHKKSRRSKSVLSAIACPCIASFWTEHSQIKKKPANSQISDFFYASKDNL
jgi:hypothetical protein